MNRVIRYRHDEYMGKRVRVYSGRLGRWVYGHITDTIKTTNKVDYLSIDPELAIDIPIIGYWFVAANTLMS